MGEPLKNCVLDKGVEMLEAPPPHATHLEIPPAPEIPIEIPIRMHSLARVPAQADPETQQLLYLGCSHELRGMPVWMRADEKARKTTCTRFTHFGWRPLRFHCKPGPTLWRSHIFL